MPTVVKALPENDKLIVCTAHSIEISSNGIQISTNHLCVCVYKCIHMYIILYVYAIFILLDCTGSDKSRVTVVHMGDNSIINKQ